MRALLAVLAALLAAGCAEPARPAEASEPALPPSQAAPVAPPEAILGSEHAHDSWGDAAEMLLIDDLKTTESSCQGGRASAITLTTEGVGYGCVGFAPEGALLVPQGTAALRYEVDASDALKAGSYAVSIRTHARTTFDLAPTSEPQATGTYDLDANDWDLPHEEMSSFALILRGHAPLGVLNGDVAVRVVALRDPAWVPIVDAAHLDHWILGDRHTFVRDGVAVALDVRATYRSPDASASLGAGEPAVAEAIQLADIILPGSKTAVLVVQALEVRGCPAGAACALGATLNTGSGYARASGGSAVSRSGPGWTITAYRVPQDVGADSTYATQSASEVRPWLRADYGVPLAPKWGSAAMGIEADGRFAVESWRGEADLDDVQARYGLASA